MSLVTIKNEGLSASTDSDGQLVSILLNGTEYMHGGGKPAELKDFRDKLGWTNSEIIMFPIIGRPANGKVTANGREYSMDAHGISRAVPFVIEDVTSTGITASQTCTALKKCTVLNDERLSVLNPKYSHEKSNTRYLEWMPFMIEKTITVDDAVQVELTVRNLSKRQTMPYRLGWHPAFRVQGRVEDAVFEMNQCATQIVSLDEVISQSQTGALLLPGVRIVNYVDRKTGKGVKLTTNGFNNAMLWTPSADSGMFCIEPVTQLPDKQRVYLDGVNKESLEPLDRKTYKITIQPF